MRDPVHLNFCAARPACVRCRPAIPPISVASPRTTAASARTAPPWSNSTARSCSRSTVSSALCGNRRPSRRHESASPKWISSPFTTTAISCSTLCAKARSTIWNTSRKPPRRTSSVTSSGGKLSNAWPKPIPHRAKIQMNGIPHISLLRSESIFGLSFVIMIFDDTSINDWNRQKVLERLTQVSLPAGIQPQIGTDWSTVGQIYWYTLRSMNPRYDLTELRSIEDWTLLKEFKSVPNVVDVSDFGGTVREYQVRVDPNKLVSYGLSIGQVEQQLTNNNINAGGSFVEAGLQQMNVRTIGLFKEVKDIEQTVIKTQNGTALRVKDIAEVTQGQKIRLGHIAKAIHRVDGKILDNDDVIYCIVLLRKGADAGPTLEAIHAKVKELNDHILPPGVKIVPMLDRADLLRFTQIGRAHV